MNEPILQLTLRELKQSALSDKFWLGLFCIAIILAVAGPFDTIKQFSTIPRFFYWLGIAVSTYFIAIFFNVCISTFLERRIGRRLLCRSISALIAGIAIGFWVFFVNTFLVNIDELKWHIFITLVTNCMMISFAVSAIYFIVDDALLTKQEKTMETSSNSYIGQQTSPFLSRLSKPLGKDLISLQAQDHYVEAKTTMGSELVLIRLSDAIAELDGFDGLQTHRSWWVATKHISEQKRIDGKPFLTLNNGTEIPISRTYQAGVKRYFSA